VRELTVERLREVLTYSPRSGFFRWRRPGRRVRVGDVAGSVDGRGYRKITIDRQTYPAHHLAWFYTTGSWPSQQLDHRNGDRADDRLANIREATRQENDRNRRCVNRWGLKGIYRQHGRWCSRIKFGGRSMHLGMFDTAEEAHAAYCAAAREHFGQFACDGNRAA
jgi:hypothetical protein